MKPELGHVVEEFYIGRTKVRICDDYCRDRTPQEIEKILNRIARIAENSFLAAQRRSIEETASNEKNSKKSST